MLQTRTAVKTGFVSYSEQTCMTDNNILSGCFNVFKNPLAALLQAQSDYCLIGKDVVSFAYVKAYEEERQSKYGHSSANDCMSKESSIFYTKAIILKSISYDAMIDLCSKSDFENDDYNIRAVFGNMVFNNTVCGTAGKYSAVVNSGRNVLATSKADESILATTGHNTHCVNYGSNSITIATDEQTAITTHGNFDVAVSREDYANVIANGDDSLAIAYGMYSRATVNGKNSVAIAFNFAKAKGCLGSTLIFIFQNGSYIRYKKVIVDDLNVKSNVFYNYHFCDDVLIPTSDN